MKLIDEILTNRLNSEGKYDITLEELRKLKPKDLAKLVDAIAKNREL